MDFIFKVDPIRRNIKVPDGFTVLTMDHNIHKLVFVCPYYEDFAFDSASIVFMIDAPDGKQYIIPAEDYESFPNSPAPYIKFTLTLKSYITSVVGYMSFCITADIISSGNVIEKSWHSKNISISVGGHIDNDDSEDIPEEDVPTINQRLNNLDSKVGRLQTTVNGMANGSPTPVATVAEMTDESAVYLYTGSETGYTAGNWYYYNGSAWTSGGVYGGAVTDTTLSISGAPADAKAVGDALAEKADADDVEALGTRVTAAEGALEDKADADDVTAIDERVIDLQSDINKTTIAGNAWNIVGGLTPLERTYIRGTTKATNQNNFFSFEKIPCKPGTKYYLFCEKLNESPTTAKYGARFATFYDSSESVIGEYVNYPLTEIVSPSGAAYVSLSFIYKVEAVGATDGVKGDYYFTDTPADERNKDTVLNPSALIGYPDIKKGYDNNMRFPCINFQFDDGSANDADIVSIFNTFGYRCGFALISDITDENVTRYLGYQDIGYEILCHADSGTGMNDTTVSPETIETRLSSSKKTLEAHGFKINGFVTPSSNMAPVFRPILQKYYQWAETVYYGAYTGSGKPYMLPNDGAYNGKRVSLQSTTLANQKAAVDAAIANYGCLTFYGHAANLDTTDNLTTANLTELLTYIKQKADAGICTIGTPSDVIRGYFAVRNTDIIHPWVSVSPMEASLDNRFTATDWAMAYNEQLKLFTFAIRIKPTEDVSGQISPLFVLPKAVLGNYIIQNESGRNCICYNGNVLLQGSGTWASGTNYRFSGTFATT